IKGRGEEHERARAHPRMAEGRQRMREGGLYVYHDVMSMNSTKTDYRDDQHTEIRTPPREEAGIARALRSPLALPEPEIRLRSPEGDRGEDRGNVDPEQGNALPGAPPSRGRTARRGNGH